MENKEKIVGREDLVKDKTTGALLNVDSDGLHVKVNHQNHGMYFPDNLVKLSGVMPDVVPSKLTSEYVSTSTDSIPIDSISNFTTFENVGVGTTNVGYVLIGNEIISYTSTSGNSLAGTIGRGSDPVTYPVGTPVYKYELGGVSLRRINKTHDLTEVGIANSISYDSYNIKLDMTEDGTPATNRGTESGYPKLYLNQTKSAGGYKVKASQNIPFEVITPVVQNLTVKGTSVGAEVRTTTSQSISGNETPYLDAQFETIALNEINYLDSPRLIASKVNEDQYLTNFKGSKSLNMKLSLGTIDTRVSPVVDSQRVSAILTSNRINDEIENYATDRRVNEIGSDPSACQYISKEMVLENSATSLKVLLSAHINLNSDIRVLYSISEKPGSSPIFVPFPGYSNLNAKGEVIAAQNNDGQSDKFISKSNGYGFESQNLEFKEYVFTADNLPTFRSYRIKIILTSTSQVYVPRVKDLRVIALA